jgi:hypothetical protein
VTDESTPGVLLQGEDGTHYFIPHTDLSGYAVSIPKPLAAGADVADNVPRLHAFSVKRVDDESAASIVPMPEGGQAAAILVPMPEAGPPSAGQS